MEEKQDCDSGGFIFAVRQNTHFLPASEILEQQDQADCTQKCFLNYWSHIFLPHRSMTHILTYLFSSSQMWQMITDCGIDVNIIKPGHLTILTYLFSSPQMWQMITDCGIDVNIIKPGHLPLLILPDLEH